MNQFNYDRLNPQSYWQNGNDQPIKLNGLPQSGSPQNNVSQRDSIALSGLPGSATTSVNLFYPVGNDVDQLINQINNTPDPNMRSYQLKELFIQLLDEDNFAAAEKAVNATPSLIYKNAMFKGLVQELVVSGYIDKAVTLTNSYGDARIKGELLNYISNYVNFNGNSTKAAQVIGDSSFFNVASLKAQVLWGSVSNKVSSAGNYLTSFWSTPSTGNKIAQSALSIVGKQYRQKFLDYGNLACAYAVSQAFKGVPGLEKANSAECNSLASKMVQAGFKKVASGDNYKPIKGYIDYKPGDVVFFSRAKKNGYGHIGIVAEVKNGIPYMVHNSSSKREVVKVRLDQYYKTPVAVYRKP